ncbi:hypothetical protein [Mycoplasmopsis cynos]|uniref:MFS transporter n=2 Tax=Mycoplasmopsis cynos TaxID=171284 RepID=A0A449AH70_9BACT|nr:hypothetical protein [Mycoplasmopsis cynos]WQQ14516.1 hypothetical protein RRG42_02820 [Mycoplasmopsis cynos]VEU64307.1 Uncharacterised protein [Mycoplasmopsis cynos]VEU64402.1 Uncharacterised protein [Mycoplasmopsis cynos]
MEQVITKKTNIINKFKYTSALIISILGTEAVKLSSSVYIFKLTENFWLVSLFYLFIQLPALIVYIFGPKIVQKFTNKQIIFFADFSSFLVVLIVFVIYFLIDTNIYGHTFSWILTISSSLYGLFNSFRFLAIKNIIFYLSNNSHDMKQYNLFNSLGLSFASFLSPILGFLLFKYFPFWATLLLNMITFLTSTSLYLCLKQKKNHIEFIEQHDVEIKTSKNKYLNWTFAISLGFLITILLYPKQAGINQFFSFVNYDYKEWTFIFTICIFGFGLIGTLCSFLLNKINAHNRSLYFNIIILVIALLSFIWLFLNIINDPKLLLISYLILNALTQMLSSLVLPIGNNYIFMIFDKKEFTRQNSYILVYRIVFYTILILLLTVLYLYAGFVVMFLMYSLILLIICLFIFYSKYKIQKQEVNQDDK